MDDSLVDDYGVSEAPPVYEAPVDEEQEREAKEERAMVQQARALMGEIIAWFDAEIAWASSINGLDPESSTLTEQVLAKKRIEKFMVEAKTRLTILSNEHLED